MKTLYVEGAFGEPYKIVVSDFLLGEARKAQRVLRMLPWKGELFLPVDAISLEMPKVQHVQRAEICIGKDQVTIMVEGPEGRELMVNSDDDLLTIPDIYLSREFYFDLKEHVFLLSKGDIDLVERWKILQDQKLQNYA